MVFRAFCPIDGCAGRVVDTRRMTALPASDPPHARRAAGQRVVPFLPGLARATQGGEPVHQGGQAQQARRLDADIVEALGPLAAVAADPQVTDVFLTAEGSIHLDRGRGVELVPGLHLAPDGARRLVVHLIAVGGRHIDEATPCCDVRLGDGLRAHGVLPPISPGGALLSLRLPRPDIGGLDDLGMPVDAVAALRRALEARHTLLITGATGSGKTTLLSAWLSGADARDRILVLEDVAEARIRHPHVVALEARQPNLEGAGGVDLARLVREALRMRPDRLVVGECRGAEVREFLAALNTGHRGGAGTLHANGLPDVAARLEAVGMLAGLAPTALARQAVSGIDLVAHLDRDAAGARRVAFGVLRLDARDRLIVRPIDADEVACADPLGDAS